jgi:dimethylaniline monooxygenase (N-oxide forming)
MARRTPLTPHDTSRPRHLTKETTPVTVAGAPPPPEPAGSEVDRAPGTLGSSPDPSHLDTQAVVIGAGPAGLAAAKSLAARGIDFRWFEKGSMVGGLWRIDNDNGATVAYRTLHLNSSRQRTQYPSFPMPDDWPDFPSHELMASYFESFAETFDLTRRVTFNAEVAAVEPVPAAGDPGANGWEVTTTAGQRITCAAVLVANGHHSVPRMPSLPGDFDGHSFHSSAYREPSVFTDRDVLVVGVGNSGMDIACDAATVARRVLLATRHGVHVIPKYAFGRPLDHFSLPASAFLPFRVERLLYEAVLRAAVGRPEGRGLPRPDHRLLAAHPTVSATLLDRVGHGDVVMKPGPVALEGTKVRFSDDSVEPVDVLVYATGYDISLPFLAPEVFDVSANRMPLYLRVVAPRRPGLYLLGFVQSIGANIALMEHQAEWVGDLLTGACELPPDAAMEAWIEADQRAMASRYVRSERHTIQVDYWRYIRALERARRRGSAAGARSAATSATRVLRSWRVLEQASQTTRWATGRLTRGLR